MEVEAIEQNISRICHKIYFPNDTSEVSPLPQPRLSDWLPRLLACSPQQNLPTLVSHGEPKEAD